MKKFTAVVTVIFIVAAALWGPGWIDEHPTAAAGLGVALAFLALGLAVLAGVVIGGLWTRRAMGDGATIALKAQQVNDEWDAKKTVAFAALMRQGVTLGRQLPGQAALPLPGQLPGQVALADGTILLPPLTEFGHAGRNFQVIDGESETPYENAG